MPYTRGVVIEVDPEDREWLSRLQATLHLELGAKPTRTEVFKRLRACWEDTQRDGQEAGR